MKGNKHVIERLNEAMKLELGAINQYWLHYRLLANWGYTKLAKKERKEPSKKWSTPTRSLIASFFSMAIPTCNMLRYS